MRLNPQLAKRPRFKHLPIPYVQFMRTNGVPDFRVIDETRKRQCVEQRLCGLCGQPLDALIAFVGGPLCVQNRLYDEPPLHIDCAHDAMHICPYLCRGKEYFKGTLPRDNVSNSTMLAINAATREERPAEIAIYVTRSYTKTIVQGHKYVLAAAATRLEWYNSDGQRTRIEIP